MILGLTVVIMTHRDYGISWDEQVFAEYGELTLRYFESGFEDRRCNQLENNRYYGALFEGFCAFIYESIGHSKYEIRHLLSALTALVTLLGVFVIGRLLGGPTTGVLAALLLALLPRFYGHAFINSKDIPFACAFTWSIFAIARILAHRRLTWGSVVLAGITIGLATSVRPGGGLLLFFFGLAGACYFVAAESLAGRLELGSAPPLKVCVKVVAIMAIAWTVMVLFWPWAHENPFLNPIKAYDYATRFPYRYPIRFEGLDYKSHVLPSYYMAKSFAITTPLPFLAMLAVGLVVSVKRWIDRPASQHGHTLVLVLLWVGFPLAYLLVKQTNVYDGIRHFMFLVPGFSVLAAAGGMALIRLARAGRIRVAVSIVVVALSCTPIFSLIKLHPYQYTYFNELVGGLDGAQGNYETEYWVTSFKEAMKWVRADSRRYSPRRPSVVIAAGLRSTAIDCVRYYAGKRIRFRMKYKSSKGRLPRGVDYYIGTSRFGLHKNYAGSPIVHEVRRGKALFVVVRRRRRW